MSYNKKILHISALVGLLICPLYVFASAPLLGEITGSIITMLKSIVPLLTSVAVVFFLWNVLVFVRFAHNSDQLEKSRGRMIAGIIGLVVMFSLWGIIRILGGAFDVMDDTSHEAENVEEFIVDTPY